MAQAVLVPISLRSLALRYAIVLYIFISSLGIKVPRNSFTLFMLTQKLR